MAAIPAPYLNISACCITPWKSIGFLKDIPDRKKYKLYKRICRKIIVLIKCMFSLLGKHKRKLTSMSLPINRVWSEKTLYWNTVSQKIKKSPGQKNLWNQINQFHEKIFWQKSNFCNFKNGQKSIFELGKCLKLPKM